MMLSPALYDLFQGRRVHLSPLAVPPLRLEFTIIVVITVHHELTFTSLLLQLRTVHSL